LWFDSRSGDKPYDMFHAEECHPTLTRAVSMKTLNINWN
jgi:hypothetical protein